MPKIVERVSLYYREGSSDKIYIIELTEVSPGEYNVAGYNGRRGAQLVAQPKTFTPVTLAEARRIFKGLEQAKLNHPKTPYKIAERQTGAPTTVKPKESASPTIPDSDREVEIQTPQPSPEGYRASHLDALEF